MQDRHHQLAVVLLDRALAGVEGVAPGPAEAEVHLERAVLGVLVGRARVFGHVQTRNADAPAGARDGHRIVEHRGRSLPGFVAVAAGLEADGVDSAVHDRLAHDLGDLVLDRVADDDDRGTQKLRRVGRGQSDRARARHIDRRARRHARADAAVVAGREDVAEHGEVQDLLHRLVLIREGQEVEVRKGDHHVIGLTTGPATHVHVPVGRAGPLRVDVKADAGLALHTCLAAPAGDVERDGAEVALLYKLDVVADLDHLAGNLVPQCLPLWRRRPAPDHVLIGTADVGRDDPQDHAVRSRGAPVPHVVCYVLGDLELRVADVLYRDLAWSLVNYASIFRHRVAPLTKSLA